MAATSSTSAISSRVQIDAHLKETIPTPPGIVLINGRRYQLSLTANTNPLPLDATIAKAFQSFLGEISTKVENAKQILLRFNVTDSSKAELYALRASANTEGFEETRPAILASTIQAEQPAIDPFISKLNMAVTNLFNTGRSGYPPSMPTQHAATASTAATAATASAPATAAVANTASPSIQAPVNAVNNFLAQSPRYGVVRNAWEALAGSMDQETAKLYPEVLKRIEEHSNLFGLSPKVRQAAIALLDYAKELEKETSFNWDTESTSSSSENRAVLLNRLKIGASLGDEGSRLMQNEIVRLLENTPLPQNLQVNLLFIASELLQKPIVLQDLTRGMLRLIGNKVPYEQLQPRDCCFIGLNGEQWSCITPAEVARLTPPPVAYATPVAAASPSAPTATPRISVASSAPAKAASLAPPVKQAMIAALEVAVPRLLQTHNAEMREILKELVGSQQFFNDSHAPGNNPLLRVQLGLYANGQDAKVTDGDILAALKKGLRNNWITGAKLEKLRQLLQVPVAPSPSAPEEELAEEALASLQPGPVPSATHRTAPGQVKRLGEQARIAAATLQSLTTAGSSPAAPNLQSNANNAPEIELSSRLNALTESNK